MAYGIIVFNGWDRHGFVLVSVPISEEAYSSAHCTGYAGV
jgi:hypothetical protein